MKYNKFIYVVAIALACLLIGCSPKEKTEKLTLKLGAMASMDYLPYVIAQQMGIYDSLGLNLEIVKFFSPNERDAALRAGEIDGTIIDYSGAAMQQAGGIDLALVVKHDGFFKVMASKKIASLAELANKQVAISRNTVIEYACDQMLTLGNLNELDIQKVEVNKIPLRLEMLLSNKIDAGIFPDPFSTIAERSGFHCLASTTDMHISVTGTAFLRKAINNKGDAIKRLLEGYNRGVLFIRERPRSDWARFLIEDVQVPEQFSKTIELPAYTMAEMPSEDDIKRTIDWLRSKQLVDENYTGDNLLDKQFIPMNN